MGIFEGENDSPTDVGNEDYLWQDCAACWSDPVQHRQGVCTIGRRLMVKELIKTPRTQRPLDMDELKAK
jgi:hypothetical protein